MTQHMAVFSPDDYKFRHGLIDIRMPEMRRKSNVHVRIEQAYRFFGKTILARAATPSL